MPRFTAISRASLAAVLVAVALGGCTSSPRPAATSSCSGMVKKVLLSDDSASQVTAFNAGDVAKIFDISGSPAPSCSYVSTSTSPSVNGVSYAVTHRTLLYIGLTDAQTSTLVAAVRKTVSVAPWTVEYDDGIPAASTATPAPSASAGALPISYAGLWQYDFNGPDTDQKGEMGYYVALPVTSGTAAQAGLASAVNVVRVETELRQPKK